MLKPKKSLAAHTGVLVRRMLWRWRLSGVILFHPRKRNGGSNRLQSCNILCLIYFSPRGLTLCPHEVPLSPKLDRNATETSTSGFPYFRTLNNNNVSWSGSRAAPAGSQHPYTKKDHQMKKVLAMLFLALSVSASFAQTASNVVRWKTIVCNITVSNNDSVTGINPGTTPWSATAGRARVNLSTTPISFDPHSLAFNAAT